MRISVDGSRIRNNKVAFSNLSGIVWTGALLIHALISEFRHLVISRLCSWRIVLIGRNEVVTRYMNA